VARAVSPHRGHGLLNVGQLEYLSVVFQRLPLAMISLSGDVSMAEMTSVVDPLTLTTHIVMDWEFDCPCSL
jgi:hypothetical protein